MAENFPFRLKWWHIFVALGIVGFALLLRYVMIVEQATIPNSDFIPQGDDPLNYFNRAVGIIEGRFPVTAFDGMQPGVYYWFAFLMSIVGRKIEMLHLALASVDAIAVGFMIACGWLLTKRLTGGYLAGILYAIYPPSIFYASTFLSEGTALILLVLMLFLILWQRERSQYWHSIGLGLIFGALLVTRGNLAPVAAIWVLWYWFQRQNLREWLIHVTLAVVFSVVIVSPFTWWNYHASGKFQLVTQSPDFQTYAANNRDSTGIGGSTLAYATVDTDYWTALIRDFAIAPEHFFGLVAWRTALHWSADEPANTVDLETFRQQSQLLRLIPFNFWHLAVLGLIGLASLSFTDRKLFTFMGLSIAWFTFMIAISFAISRLRYPIVALLLLLATQALFYWWQILREKRLSQIWRSWALPVALIGALFLFSAWAFPKEGEPPLPPKRTYQTLPADAIATSRYFGNGDLEFVGWRPFPQWWQAPTQEWMHTDDAYAIELFWRVPDTTDTTYNFFLAYVDGIRYGGADRPIGAVSFPALTTEKWQSGMIYGEIVSFLLDQTQPIPTLQSGQIRLGVWYWDSEGLIVNVPSDDGQDTIIQSMAIYPSDTDTTPEETTDPIIFGDLIALHDYQIPAQAQTGETIQLPFHWQALQEINDDYRIFLHVVDEAGEIVANGDNVPVVNLFTQNWMPHYPLSTELPLTMPSIAGTYQIYAGLYNQAGRLPVDAPDNRILLGIIVVE